MKSNSHLTVWKHFLHSKYLVQLKSYDSQFNLISAFIEFQNKNQINYDI